ncbi:transcriptional regulator, LacI family [Beutenbergia cavernae DSM 12333]|uniref:Transcriptional regulator, LacI family n=1 Tax=Beutenbergia cavernae (strain ATCC BAA-8 / DSM 12333 / CCUG 43141 / JCM 11478 / NBRC 16432 / NCIMB 13614 / HKI 0122) TaxID=471853 RepID=C5C1F2_BEUC1|nr:LacI family DNA-binding transcriptional regulator [Beutenbergia cavernae]ACQ81562.1 transcriptional regulator, LacI family [Beutenbergia cavernae DSM 12333]
MAEDAPRATIASIAAEAGVSVPTVSKVLNGRPDVAPATRALVEEVIERHSYTRRGARGRSRSKLVELVFHELDAGWAAQIIRGVERVAAAERLGVVLSELGGAHRPRQEWLDDVFARGSMGVVFVLSEVDAGQRRQLLSRGVPFVVVDTAGEQPADVPTVGSANWSGGLAATRHLLSLGHRRIAVISGQPDVLCSRARVDGYRSALEEAGIAVDASLIRYGDFALEGGYRHGLELLGAADRPTAVFAGSDMQAVGLLRAARELRLRVPEDLSVVGYDDLPVAEWIGPALTTIRQPLGEMAATATRMLLALARGETLRNPRMDLAVELVVRGSTAPPE